MVKHKLWYFCFNNLMLVSDTLDIISIRTESNEMVKILFILSQWKHLKNLSLIKLTYLRFGRCAYSSCLMSLVLNHFNISSVIPILWLNKIKIMMSLAISYKKNHAVCLNWLLFGYIIEICLVIVIWLIFIFIWLDIFQM